VEEFFHGTSPPPHSQLTSVPFSPPSSHVFILEETQ
jgi:hypothetical protein